MKTHNPLRSWWDSVVTYGPFLGYYAKPDKSWLIVKEQYYEQAQIIFADTQINITKDGRKQLGACIGTPEFIQEYVNGKVDNLVFMV